MITPVSNSAWVRTSVGDAVGEAATQARLDLLDEPGVLVLPGRAGIAGHVGAVALGEGHVAALGDGEGVVAGLGQLGEQLPHLGRRLEVVLAALELEPVGVGHRRAGLHAEQHLVRVGVGRRRIVQVVGGDQRQVQLARDLEQVVADPALDRQAVVHQLHVVVPGAEDVAELGRAGDRLVVLAEPQIGLHLTRRAAGGGQQSLRVGLQQFAVHPRLVEVALQRGQRAQPEQVVHPGGVLAPQRHVGEGPAARHVVAARALGAVAPADPLAFRAMRLGRQVRLDADDRLHAAGLRGLVELEGAEAVAVIGDRDRRHAHLLAALEQIGHPGRTVEHRVLRVHVEVDERIARHALTTSS